MTMYRLAHCTLSFEYSKTNVLYNKLAHICRKKYLSACTDEFKLEVDYINSFFERKAINLFNVNSVVQIHSEARQ